jgi:hypothetical protein
MGIGVGEKWDYHGEIYVRFGLAQYLDTSQNHGLVTNRLAWNSVLQQLSVRLISLEVDIVQ